MNRDCWFTTWSGASVSGDPIFTQPINDSDPNLGPMACQEQCRLNPECRFAVAEVLIGDGQCLLYGNTEAQVVTDTTGTTTTWEKQCTYYGKIYLFIYSFFVLWTFKSFQVIVM